MNEIKKNLKKMVIIIISIVVFAVVMYFISFLSRVSNHNKPVSEDRPLRSNGKLSTKKVFIDLKPLLSRLDAVETIADPL